MKTREEEQGEEFCESQSWEPPPGVPAGGKEEM